PSLRNPIFDGITAWGLLVTKRTRGLLKVARQLQLAKAWLKQPSLRPPPIFLLRSLFLLRVRGNAFTTYRGGATSLTQSLLSFEEGILGGPGYSSREYPGAS